MTNQEIIATGQTIANETHIGGNTAERVGGVIEGIGENLTELGGVLNELIYSEVELSDYTNGYIDANGNIASPSVTAYRIYLIPVTLYKQFILRYNSYRATAARCYAVYSSDVIAEIGRETCLEVGPVGAGNTDFNISISQSEAKLLAIQTHYSKNEPHNDWGCVLKEAEYRSLAEKDIDEMIASRDYVTNGNVSYDNNEIPQSYNIKWSDGTLGTVVMSNFDNDVFEYTTITAVYKDKTIVYALTFDDNGYLINETYNIL